MVKPGRLYGLGVGPGDPELMTVKAWRILSLTPVVAYLAANGGMSTARAIAAPFIPEGATEIAIDMPMRVDREAGQAAYDTGSGLIAAHLAAGRDVAFLCEGDPFFYGSFIYIFERLGAAYEVVVVPGVTSVTAAAARLRLPLTRRDEVLKVLPATLDADRLREELMGAETAAIIKVGRHFAKVRGILSALDLISRAIAIEKATHTDERIRPVQDITEDTLPYFTTILVRT